jgi:hypothetical protein
MNLFLTARSLRGTITLQREVSMSRIEKELVETSRSSLEREQSRVGVLMPQAVPNTRISDQCHLDYILFDKINKYYAEKTCCPNDDDDDDNVFAKQGQQRSVETTTTYPNDFVS